MLGVGRRQTSMHDGHDGAAIVGCESDLHRGSSRWKPVGAEQVVLVEAEQERGGREPRDGKHEAAADPLEDGEELAAPAAAPSAVVGGVALMDALLGAVGGQTRRAAC
jgi:hypothetical protein